MERAAGPAFIESRAGNALDLVDERSHDCKLSVLHPTDESDSMTQSAVCGRNKLVPNDVRKCGSVTPKPGRLLLLVEGFDQLFSL